MSSDGIVVERITTRAEFEKFAAFPFDVYGNRDAWWPSDISTEVDLLDGRSAIAALLEMAPFWARRNGRVIGRVTAVVNHRYNRHWNELVGQLIHFESLPGEEEAACLMLEEASGWLRSHGMKTARSGFAAFLDYPYSIDNYGVFPSFLLRASPEHYHRCFKSSGFFTEKGLSDWTAALTPELLDRYRRMVTAVRPAGVSIRSWREFGFLAAIDAWTDITNAAFAHHWGWNPITRQEVRPMLAPLHHTPVADLSMVAVADGEPVGAVFSVPDLSPTLARIRPGLRVDPERGGGTRGALVNIGVLEPHRGRGINLAMAARSFLKMADQKMRFAGYTLVVDDNWPSRRTAVKLGAHITANFVAYRREL